jgi:uncharacterized delta-60 repeat protein
MGGRWRFLTFSLAFAVSIPAASRGEEGFDWVQRKRQPFPGIDQVQAIAIDPMGGVLAAGNSEGREVPSRARAVKLDPAGKEAWSWTGEDGSCSPPGCAAFDPEGNAYLAVGALGDGNPAIEIVKFDRSGSPIRTAAYPTSYPQAIAGIDVDGEGRMAISVYAGVRDFFTVLFDADGTLAWSATHDGPTGGDERARAIAFDANGNLYVTGSGDGDHEDHRFPSTVATVKYDRSGAEVWGAAHGGDGSSVLRGTDMAFAADGSVFVAGIREWPVPGFVTVKYGSGGDEMWAAAFDSPEANGAVLVLDPASGDIGVAAGDRVVRLTPDGIESWSATAEGVVFRSVVIDREGGIVAAGTAGTLEAADIAAFKWTAGGRQVWSARIEGAGNGEDALMGMALDGEGKVILAGSTTTPDGDLDFLASALAETGAEVWRATSGTTRTTEDGARAVAIDPQGSIVAAGALAQEFGTVKYAPDGTELWAAHAGSDYHDDYEGAYALVLDAAGNAAVTGRSARRFLTIRYDREGSELWRAADPEAGAGSGYAIALDGAGNVKVAGFCHFSAPDGNSDFLVARYDASGAMVWEDRPGGEDSDIARAIALDREGNTIVAGSFDSGNAFSSQAVVAKYDPAGGRLWEAVYDRGFWEFTDEGEDSAHAVAADLDGNVYMAGTTHVGDHFEILTVKYDAQGRELWVRTYSPAGHDASAAALVLDGSSAVYVAGSVQGEDSRFDITVLKYDPSGSLLWTGRAEAPPGQSGSAYAVCLDAGGNDHLAGKCWPLTRPVTATFDPSGNLLGTRAIEGPGAFNAIAVDAAGNVCAAGSSAGDFVVAKYNGAAATPFRRGDANADGNLDLSDGVTVLAHLFLGGARPPCERAADADASGALDLSDAISIFVHLYRGGPGLPDPFAFCEHGVLPLPLTCESFPPCGA